MSRKRAVIALGLAAVVALAFAAAPARADVYMKQRTHTDAFKIMGKAQPEKDSVMVFWLAEGKARTDNEGDNTSTIFLADKKLIYALDHNKRQYSETPLDFDKMFEEAAAAREPKDSEEAEAMKKMPGFMKNMMKGVMGGMSAKVTETGETKTIGNWACRKYLIDMTMMAGEMKSEAWATEDLKIDYGLAFAMANAMMAAQPGFDKVLQEMRKVKGVVVYQTATTTMMGAEVASTTELLECSDKSSPAGTYDIPAGYKKVKAVRGM
ncbi:MAG TPA: hypothetical protein PLP83_04135 [Candidatus Aminicenantes bacterium]|nr:hypothetical protein [Candidatus Aminicenantes bacterium]